MRTKSRFLLIAALVGLLVQCSPTEDGEGSHHADGHGHNDHHGHNNDHGYNAVRRVAKGRPTFGLDKPEPQIPADGSTLSWPSLTQSLLPLQVSPDPAEDAALSNALRALSKQPSWVGASDLRRFVEAHPHSRWTAAVSLNLGDVAYRMGRFSQALTWWENAWKLAKDADNPAARAIADQAIAEYAKMNARVGRKQELRRVLAEVQGRPVQGDAAVKLDGAREGLWMMEHNPGVAFRCGPYALVNVLSVLEPESMKRVGSFLKQVQSPEAGFSLKQVASMAPMLGLDLQMVRREPGQRMVLPAVIHFAVGHFGALVEERDGKYLLKDPTFGNETWMSTEDIDAEASGYFLVQAGALPTGYRSVGPSEADDVVGKGHSGTSDPDETGRDDHTSGGDSTSCAMATYTFHTLLASLSVSDTPVRYATARGPHVAFTVTYNQREAKQPVSMQFTNFSPSWVSSWMSYLEDDPATPGAAIRVWQRGGGGAVFTNYSSATQTYGLHSQTKSTLRRLTGNTYVREYADGSKEFYEHYIGTTGPSRRIFLSRVVDPQNNEVSLYYGSSYPTRVESIADAVGLSTLLSYDYPGNPYLVTRIEDPFGRPAQFSYETIDGIPRLRAIEDAFGTVSSFGYSNGAMTSLTTPYGTTNFELSALQTGSEYALIRYVEATDPYGNKERVEYNLSVSSTGMPALVAGEFYPDSAQVEFDSDVFFVGDRNSFHWDKLQMRQAPGNYRAAHLYHWIQPDFADAAMSILESEKPPLEGRIWYNYTDQTYVSIQGKFADPSVVARVVVDANGTKRTQASRFEYNNLGNLMHYTDPVGREIELAYAVNGVDILEVRRKTAVQSGAPVWRPVWSFTYDPTFPPHRPRTATDAAGRITQFTYNSAGQIATATNALSQVVTYNYESDSSKPGYGKVISISGDVAGGNRTFAYDGQDRIRTVSDSEGLTVAFDYDVLDRLKRVTYPDQSYEEFVFQDQSLVAERDRAGRWTRHRVNALRQRILTRDPSGRVMQSEWCLCGQLRKQIDGRGNTVEWMRDLQGRVETTRFADGSELHYGYDYSGRSSVITDALGRTTKYSYALDDGLTGIDYQDSSMADVSYIHDPYFDRVQSRTDGSGVTVYTYHPLDGVTLGAGQLASINGPLPNDTLRYTYDAIGRPRKLEIANDSTPSSVSFVEDYDFDTRGRVRTLTTNLGTFNYAYVGQSDRVDRVDYPNGMAVDYDYYDAAVDQRLKQIKNLAAGAGSALFSQFDYTYNQDRTLATFRATQDTLGERRWTFNYDAARQLTRATQRDASQSVLTDGRYGYDPAGNRFQVSDASSARNYEVNTLNQLVSERGFGSTVFAGTVNEPATVRINGQPAVVTSSDGSAPYSFRGLVSLAEGSNTVTVQATDGSGNVTNKSYVVPAGGTSSTYEYDLSGNQRFERAANGTARREYRWDQEQRLVNFLQDTHESQFSYDGRSHRVRIRELDGGNETSNHSFVWCGDRICQERDAAGTAVVRSYFAHGVQEGSSNYFYTRDHLGSIRELVAADGTTVSARYSYDPWGTATRVGGSGITSTELFTGHRLHEASGNYLTHYRLYDPRLGRWLSRDPIEESGIGPHDHDSYSRGATSTVLLSRTGALSSYAYGRNDPAMFVDADGRNPLVIIYFVLGMGMSLEGDTYGSNNDGLGFVGTLFGFGPLAKGCVRSGAPVFRNIAEAIPDSVRRQVLNRVLNGQLPRSALTAEEVARASAYYKQVANEVGGAFAEAASQFNRLRADFLRGLTDEIPGLLRDFMTRNGL